VCRAAFADFLRPADSRPRQPAVLTGLRTATNNHLCHTQTSKEIRIIYSYHPSIVLSYEYAFELLQSINRTVA